MFGAMNKALYLALLLVVGCKQNSTPKRVVQSYPAERRVVAHYYFGMSQDDYEYLHQADAKRTPQQGRIYVDSARFDDKGHLYWLHGSSLDMLGAEYYNGRLKAFVDNARDSINGIYGSANIIAPYPPISAVTQSAAPYAIYMWEDTTGRYHIKLALKHLDIGRMTYDIDLEAIDVTTSNNIKQRDERQRRINRGESAGNSM